MSARDPDGGSEEWTTQGLGRARPPEQPVPDDRYQVIAHLGRGGSGTVFRVFDRARHITLAQKRLMVVEDVARRDRLTASFEREYYTLSELAHPSIIKVYDYGLDAAGPYYTMELVEGGDLRSQGQMPWRQVCEVLYDVSSSLAMLHSRRRVHRDVTSPNVRFTRDGKARLIDFGLMVPMGVVKEVAGTPPFMAPETVQQQCLDGRADLFSLGALAYFALAGSHAFPAKRIDQLRDLWRTPPRPLERFSVDIPPALASLVMRMISLDRGLRPSTAGEVMEKVAAMLGRKHVEVQEVTASYLTTPTLVGREEQLLQVRKLVIEAMRTRGRCIAITGGRGAGRSRFLDACVLEGKLAGATVVRADAADGARGNYGAIRALASQLLMSAPEASSRLGAGRDTIGWLLPQGQAHVSAPALGGNFLESEAERTTQMVEIRDVIRAWVRALARDRTVMVAVDDLHRLDESSAAILAALAHDADAHRILMVAAMTDEPGPGAGAAHWFSAAARTIELPPLKSEHVTRLFTGVFGDVDNISVLSAAVSGLCKGSPKSCMVIAQHLVDQEVARYQAGRWTLPSTFNHRDLPSSVNEATRTQLKALSSPARDLLDYFAFGDGALSLDALPHLVDEGDRARLFRGLDELLCANLLEVADDHYRLADPEVVLTVRGSATADRATMIHGRLADMLAATSDPGFREADHRVAAGDSEAAIAPMLRFLSVTPPWGSGSSPRDSARLLDAIIAAATRAGRPDVDLIPLELAFLRSALSLSVPHYAEHARRLLARLTRAVGLDLLDQFPDTFDPKERPTALLRAATARFTAEGGAAVTQHPFEALLSLAAASRIVTMIGASTNNVPFLRTQPALAVFVPLVPALELTLLANEAGTLLAGGHYIDSMTALDRILRMMDKPGKVGISPVTFEMVRNNVKFAKGMLQARLGHDAAFAIADELEKSPTFQINAWILRMNAHLRIGDIMAAQACRRRVELLNVEQRPPQSLEPPAMLGELDYYTWVRDVVGLRDTLARIEAVTAIHPSWEPWARTARATYEACRGNLEQAAEELAGLVAEIPRGTHACRVWAEAQHLHVLFQLQRFQEVCDRGQQYLAEGGVFAGDASARCNAEMSIALSLGHLGRIEEAETLFDSIIAYMDGFCVSGMIRAVAYQRRAMLACVARKEHDFGHYVGRFLSVVVSLNVQAVGSLHAQLISEARAAAFSLDVRHLLSPSPDEGRRESAERTVNQVLALGDGSRLQTVSQLLGLMVERTQAEGGLLFEMVRGQPLLTAHTGDVEGLGELARAEVQRLLLQLSSDEGVTASTVDTDSEGDSHGLLVAGHRFRAVILSAELDAVEPAAIALLQQGAEPRSLPWELLSAVSTALTALGGSE